MMALAEAVVTTRASTANASSAFIKRVLKKIGSSAGKGDERIGLPWWHTLLKALRTRH